MVAFWSTDSGIIRALTAGAGRPARASTSKTASRAAESDMPACRTGFDVLNGISEDLGRHARLVRRRPVDIAGQRVDLAVVAQHAERLCQAPRGEGVGGVALVIDGEVRFEARVDQVRVEGAQLLGQEHPLVDDGAARQRTDVEIGYVVVEYRLLDTPADDEEVDLELLVADAQVVGDHDLLDLGPRRVGLLADEVDVDRHLAPAVDGVAEVEDFGLDDAAAAFLGAQVGLGQEHHADGDGALGRLVAGVADVFPEKDLRDLDVDAGTVAGLAVGVDGAPVPDPGERHDPRLHHLAARLAVDGGDETDAAGVVLMGRVVKPLLGQVAGAGRPVANEVGAGFGRTAGHQ